MSALIPSNQNYDPAILRWGRNGRLVKDSQYEAAEIASQSYLNILRARAGAAEANAIIEATTEVEKHFIDGLSILGKHYENKAQTAGPIESALLADAIPDTQARAKAMIADAQHRVTRK